MTPRSRSGAAVCALLLFAGCSSEPIGGGQPQPAELRVVSSLTPEGTPGWALADSIVVEALDAAGDPLAGVPVTWHAPDGAGTVAPRAATTDSEGRVAAAWTLGLSEGVQAIAVTAGDLAPVAVQATASTFHGGEVGAGSGHACALTAAGRAYCWGGLTDTEGAVDRPVPVQGDLTFERLAVGDDQVCGLTPDGTAYCWTATHTPTPVATSLRFLDLSAAGFDQSGASSACGVTAAGEVWCWGDNVFGKLGDGTLTSSEVPVRVASQVAFAHVEVGAFHACAVTAAGELWCWGEQETEHGGLGPRPAGYYSTPVAVAPDHRFLDLSLGRDFTCGLTADAAAYCWGTNQFGSLGTGDNTAYAVEPSPVTGGLTFQSLSAGSMEENWGLSANGTLYRWGSPGGDQAQLSPLVVAPALAFVTMDPGNLVYGFANACGTTAAGAVYCVGPDGHAVGVPRPEGVGP
jgi:hypothetical protein